MDANNIENLRALVISQAAQIMELRNALESERSLTNMYRSLDEQKSAKIKELKARLDEMEEL